MKNYEQTTKTDCVDGAGWMGIPRGDEGECDCAGAEAGVRRADPEISQHLDPYVRAIRRIAARADGQQRSGAHEHGRGAHRAHGHYANRPADREQTAAKSADFSASDGAGAGEATAFCGIVQRWRGALSHSTSVCA